jgi:hypothetical protein
MKSHKNVKTAQIVKTQRAAAAALGITPKTLRTWRAENAPGFSQDGAIDLEKLKAWAEARQEKRAGSAHLRARKLRAECIKLETANAIKRDELVSRVWCAERFHAYGGALDGIRVKSEAEHPLLFAAAAGDVAACREVVMKIWDEIMAALSDTIGRAFDETTPHPVFEHKERSE